MMLVAVVALVPVSCGEDDDGGSAGTPTDQGTMLLATTTSTRDSGLLDELLPAFEKKSGCQVKTVAVGSGEALELGEKGDADVLLVHSPADEQEFMDAGNGSSRKAVMHNDFVLVGPAEDPADLKQAKDAPDALGRIEEAEAPFASRGDDSGTHTKELSLWEAAGIEPGGSWYIETGQGMGETLTIANQKQAYTLSDRGTFLATREPRLRGVGGRERGSAQPVSRDRRARRVRPTRPAPVSSRAGLRVRRPRRRSVVLGSSSTDSSSSCPTPRADGLDRGRAGPLGVGVAQCDSDRRRGRSAAGYLAGPCPVARAAGHGDLLEHGHGRPHSCDRSGGGAVALAQRTAWRPGADLHASRHDHRPGPDSHAADCGDHHGRLAGAAGGSGRPAPRPGRPTEGRSCCGCGWKHAYRCWRR